MAAAEQSEVPSGAARASIEPGLGADSRSAETMGTVTIAVASFRKQSLLRACLDSIVSEASGVPGASVVVARPQSLGDLDELRESYPTVQFVAAPDKADVPHLRGLALNEISVGTAVLTEDHCLVAAGWLLPMLERLSAGADVVGGPMENAQTERSVDWGAYFSEYGFFGPRASSFGEVPSPTGANVAYAQRLVPHIAKWYRAGLWENVVHDALRSAGGRFVFADRATVRQNGRYGFRSFCRDRFAHGRNYARKRVGEAGLVRRLFRAASTPILPLVLLRRAWRTAGAHDPNAFLRSLPLTGTFFAAWCLGEFVGYLEGGAAEPDQDIGTPAELKILLAERDDSVFPAVSLASRLSVVVPSVNGWGDLEGCLDALLAQEGGVDLEILVADRIGDSIRTRLEDYPAVRLLEAAPSTTIPELRALAFDEASGDVVGVIEDHVIVPREWAMRMLAQHAEGALVVGGSVDNAARNRLVEWASFLCEYSHCLSPSTGPAEWLTGNNVTYRHALLEKYRDVIAEGGWENRLHDAFRRDGLPLISRPEIEVGHKKHFGFGEYLSQRYLYSRSYAGSIVAGKSWPQRLFHAALSFALPPVLAWRIFSNIWRSTRYRRELILSTPMIGVFVIAWAFGEAVGSTLGAGDALSRVR